MILLYADDINTVGKSITKTKEIFITTEEETKKERLDINKEKTKQMQVKQRAATSNFETR